MDVVREDLKTWEGTLTDAAHRSIWRRCICCGNLISDVPKEEESQMLNICSVVLLPNLKPACSSNRISSVLCFSLLRMTYNMTLLG